MAFTKKADSSSGVNVRTTPKTDTSESKSTRAIRSAKPIASDDEPIHEESSRPRRPRMKSSVEASGGDTSPTRGDQVSAKPKEGAGSLPFGLSKNNAMLICGAIIVVLIIFWFMSNQKATSPNAVTQQQQNQQKTQTQQYVTSTTPQLSANDQFSSQLQNEGYGLGGNAEERGSGLGLVESDVILKDLEGMDMPEMFTVKATAWVSDFVTYKKHRAILGDGVEFYWLEGMYKNQPCRVVLPYSYYVKLPDEGAIICNIEILQTTDGNKIASYFQFDKTAYDMLNK